MKPEINSYVRTPRFCGYTEPTYYRGDYKVFGKPLGNNCMVFAAVTSRG